MRPSIRTAVSGAAAHTGVCILAGCALLAAAAWATADSNPRRQARGTHIGVSPKDIVTLVSSGTGSTLKFLRANPDGSTDAAEFVVPTGQQLVVTDVDWSGYVNNMTAKAALRVWVENKATPATRHLGYLKHEWMEAFTSNYSGGQGSSPYGGSSSGVLTGFCVASSARLTADFAQSASLGAAFGGYSGAYVIVLRGYLTVDE